MVIHSPSPLITAGSALAFILILLLFLHLSLFHLSSFTFINLGLTKLSFYLESYKCPNFRRVLGFQSFYLLLEVLIRVPFVVATAN